MKYICKDGHSLVTMRGIIGPPVDPEKPTNQEIITEKDFRNGKTGLTKLLQHKKCPIMALNEKKPEVVFDEKKPDSVTDEDSQQPEKDDKIKKEL